tara:strand:+ start:783 stop:1547 length:765 start_codon:yes stop_codon:yes gene_type:complete
MIVDFYKYEGTGNDFIIIDDRSQLFDISNNDLISSMCDRKFGIGADGLILLRNHETFDFEMLYFNSDGYMSSMCGNGGRCIVHFANYLNIIDDTTKFIAVDGVHEARIDVKNVLLKMQNVKNIIEENNSYILDTGSPHYVKFVNDISNFNVLKQGKIIRQKFTDGINVNFVEIGNYILVRTYERGVENETLSCGTGVVASALAIHFSKKSKNNSIDIKSNGGDLNVTFEYDSKNYSNIWLKGTAKMIFSGKYKC